jgi:hypothetical protein
MLQKMLFVFRVGVSPTDCCRMPRPAELLALAALLGTFAACSDAGTRHSRGSSTQAAAAPERTASESDEATRFSGRVPRLKGVPRPSDTLRMAQEYGDTSSFGAPTAVQRVGGVLVVSDRYMNPHLAVFDLRSGQLVQRIGRHGKGPREMQDPLWFQRSQSPGA